MDGQVAVAIEAERLTRQKHCIDKDDLTTAIERCQLWKLGANRSGDALGLCVDYCLAAAGLDTAEIDLWISTDTNVAWRPPGGEVLRINHHLAHAASAYYPSAMTEAAVLVLDGNGSFTEAGGRRGYEAVTIATGQGDRITVLEKVLTHSVGHFYEAVTMGLGFAPLEEGKTMGLAPHGAPSEVGRALRACFRLADDHVEFLWTDEQVRTFAREALASASPEETFATRANLAYAAQEIVEECVLHFAARACRLTGIDRLCMAGGVALNSVANGRVCMELGLSDFFAQPAAGDDGLAIGAALHGAYGLGTSSGSSARTRQATASLGRHYGQADVSAALKDLPGNVAVRESCSVDEVARLLAEGQIGAWFSGGSEFGPRSLGFRSILADPRLAGMKDILNHRVKRREWFRPFAPAVLCEHRDAYFDIPFDSPFMLLVASVRPEMRSIIPAVVHVDGTGRLQTVSPESNPAFHELLRAFQQITSTPVLLNTSFNGRNEPIVETPEDAVRAFISLQLDFLAIEGVLLTKLHANEESHDGPRRGALELL